MIRIEVAYATPTQQYVFEVSVPPHSTVETTIIASGLLEQCPEIDLTQNKCGIFSDRVKLDHLIKPGDRIEIYRPLVIDPNTARLLRAKRAKIKSKA